MWQRITATPRPERSVHLAQVDEEIIGFALAGPSDPEENPPRDRALRMIYVARSHHGTGAGQALLDAVLGDAPAYLWVAAENPRAIAFYRRNGFGLDGAITTDPHVPGIIEARMVR